MSSQPPWESQVPPQPQNSGDWNQDPYRAPQPPQYARQPQQYQQPYPGQNPSPNPPQAHYPAPPSFQQGQQGSEPQWQQGQPQSPNPYGQTTQGPYGQQSPPGQHHPAAAKTGNGGRNAGIVGTVVLLIAGIAVAAVLVNGKGTTNQASNSVGGQASTSAPAGAAAPAGSFPDITYPPPTSLVSLPAVPGAATTSSAAGTSGGGGADVGAGAPTTAISGPSPLDHAPTDTTPFTAAALAASTFADTKNVNYTLTAAGPKPCAKFGNMTVTTIIDASKCTQFMAVTWIDTSKRIIVSAMIVPFPDAATATAVADRLGKDARTGDYSQWCPPPGQQFSTLCDKIPDTATREGQFGAVHRYVVVTTAVYTDARNENSQKSWLDAAAAGAYQYTLLGQ